MSEPSNIARHRASLRSQGGPAWQERRAEIVRTAAQVFKLRGYRGTTLQDIARALSTDRASLYYYVSGKQELFEEIVGEAIDVNLARTIEIRDGPGTGAERLRRLIHSLMRSYDEFYPVLYVLVQENLKQLDRSRGPWPGTMRRRLREWEQVLIDIVRAGQRDGTISDTAPAWLIAYAVNGMVSWSNRWYRPGGGQLSAEEIADLLAQFALDGVERRASGEEPPVR